MTEHTYVGYRPLIVCLCGSTRFMAEFSRANNAETLEGKIVLSVGCDAKSDAVSSEEKMRLDELHLRKIDLADEVLILNAFAFCCSACGQICLRLGESGKSTCCTAPVSEQPYIGESTKRELEYARKMGKNVRFLNESGAHAE